MCECNDRLLDLAMQGVLLQHRIELHQFQSAGCVLAVFVRVVTRGAAQACGLMLSAFQNNLDAVAFLLCHDADSGKVLLCHVPLGAFRTGAQRYECSYHYTTLCPK